MKKNMIGHSVLLYWWNPSALLDYNKIIKRCLQWTCGVCEGIALVFISHWALPEVSTFNFQDLIVNSPLDLWLLLIYLQISYENLVLDQDNKFYPISLSILKGMDIMGRS